MHAPRRKRISTLTHNNKKVRVEVHSEEIQVNDVEMWVKMMIRKMVGWVSEDDKEED